MDGVLWVNTHTQHMKEQRVGREEGGEETCERRDDERRRDGHKLTEGWRERET